MVNNEKVFAPLVWQECQKLPVGTQMCLVSFADDRYIKIDPFILTRDLTQIHCSCTYFLFGQNSGSPTGITSGIDNRLTFDQCREEWYLLFFSGELSQVFQWLVENIKNKPVRQ